MRGFSIGRSGTRSALQRSRFLRRFGAVGTATLLAASSMLVVAGGAIVVAKGTTPTTDSCGYPNNSGGLSATTFNESTITRSAAVYGVGLAATIGVFSNDEKAMLLGVNGATPNTTSPQHVSNPVLGNTSLTDPSGRLFYPVLYITDITAGASTIGDWQHGGTPTTTVNDIFGTWSTAVLSGTTFTDTLPPAKNNWNLGTGADTPPAGTTSFNEGYGAEVRWNASDLLVAGQHLTPGNTYRFQILTHDGDQNKAGGDAGEQCVDLTIPVPAGQPALPTTAVSANLPDGTISDTVHLSGLNTLVSAGPYGTLIFKAYGPFATLPATAVCNDTVGTGNVAFTSSSQSVTGDKDYLSGPFGPTGLGTGFYFWRVFFTTAHAAENLSASSSCGAANETSTVGEITLVKTVKVTSTGTFDHTGSASPGDTLFYKIHVSNSGSVATTGVTVTDNISSSLAHGGAYQTDCSNSCSFSSPTITWTGLTIPLAGLDLTFSVTLGLVFPNGSTDVNNAAVSAQTTNCAAGTADACKTVVGVSASPVLAVLKVVDHGTAIPGDQLLYTITIDNTGNADATGKTASDAIPAKTTYTAGSCTPAANCTFNSTLNQVEWTGLDIAASTTLTLTFKVDLDPSFPSGTTDVVNTVVVPTSNCASTSVDPTCDATTVVTASPNVSYVKTVSTDNIHFFHTITAAPGQVLYYQIVATNAGNAPFVGDVADQLSTDLVDNSNAATALPGTCGPVCTYTAGTRTITWSAVSVAANGGTATLTYSVTLNASIAASVVSLDNSIISSPCVSTNPDCNTTTLLPKTQLTVTDQLTGLATGATGTVSYSAWTNSGCSTGAKDLTPTSHTVSGGVAPASNSLTIGPGAIFGNSAWFTATFTGNGAFLGQNFTTACTESASSQ